MAGAVIPCSVWDRVLWVLHEVWNPLAAHPKPRRKPGHLCALRSGVVPARSGSKVFQQTCIVRADAGGLGNGKFATVISSRVLGPGSMHPHAHQLHHLPASLPACPTSFPLPAGRGSHTVLLPCRWDALPSLPPNTAAPAPLLPVQMCTQRLVPVPAGMARGGCPQSPARAPRATEPG